MKATEGNPYGVYMPGWIAPRPLPWRYTGWISANPSDKKSFEELVEQSLQSSQGHIREVDYYEQGAACWIREG